MILLCCRRWCIGILVGCCSFVFAAQVDSVLVEPVRFIPAESEQVIWMFSGVVTNEQGEHYTYFFQMQRHDHEFDVVSAVLYADNKVLIDSDDSHAL
jgi:hypothetical protein